MQKYKFPIQDVSIYEGYAYLAINNYLAEVDESNAALMTLVKRMKGEKVESVPKKRGKKQ